MSECSRKCAILLLFIVTVTRRIQGQRTQDSTITGGDTTPGISPDITLGHLGDNDESTSVSLFATASTTVPVSVTTSISPPKGGLILDSVGNAGNIKNDTNPPGSDISFPTDDPVLSHQRPPHPGIGIVEEKSTYIFNVSALTCQSSCFRICNIEALTMYSRNWQCACDPACVVYDDCCFDYEAECLRQSPESRIETSVIHALPNQEQKKVTPASPSFGEAGIYDDDILHRPEKSDYLKCLALKYDDANGRENRLNNFLFISKCPMEYPNNIIKYRCESDEPMELLDILPVDAVFGEDLLLVPYKNIFCARCHNTHKPGEKLNVSVSYWHHKYQAKMDCYLERHGNSTNCTSDTVVTPPIDGNMTDPLVDANNNSDTDPLADAKNNSDNNIEDLMKELGYNTTFDNVQTYILRSGKCALHFDTIPSHVHACFPEVANTCPKIFKSQNNGETIEKACTAYTAPVQIELKEVGIKRYQNVHCALCNGEPLDMLTCVGRRRDPLNETHNPAFCSTTESVPGGVFRPSVLPLSILLDTTDSNGFILQVEGKNLTVEASCPQQFVYDPFIKSCRQLHACADGEVIIDGKCKPDVIQLELTLNTLIQTTEIFNLDELKNIIQEKLEVSLNVDDSDVLLNVTTDYVTEYAASALVSLIKGASYKYNISGFVKHIMVEQFSELVRNIDVLHDKLLSCGVISNLAIAVVTPNSIYKGECKDGANITRTKLTNYTEMKINGERYLYVNQSDEMFTLETIEVQFLQLENMFHRSEDQVMEKCILACSEAKRSNNARKKDSKLNCDNKLMYHPVDYEYINESIRIFSSNTVYDSNDYIKMSNGYILVCNTYNRKYNVTVPQPFYTFDETQSVLMLIFTIISLTGLFITFLTYCLLKELRNLPGKLMMNLVASLFTAQLLLLVNGTDNSRLCKANAVIAHYFWLAAFCWMNALCFAVYRTFYKVKVQQTFQSLSSFVLVKYVLYGWGFPAVIVATCITLDLATDAPFTYGDDIKCWISENNAILYGFAIPIGVLILVNILFTVATLYNLYITKKSINSAIIRKRDRLLLVVAIKLSTILGAMWVIGYIASWTQSVVLWYFFIMLNSSQGLLVCIAFVMTRRVYRLFLKSIKRSNSHGSSRGTRDVSSSTPKVL